MGFGIYVHVPFCAHRCWYCDFNAYSGLDHLAPAYMEALRCDAALAMSAPQPLNQRPEVTTIFIGGGTPSLVEPAALTAVMGAIREHWPVAPECEVTAECNPESITRAKLDAYLEAGINRLSFGVQSLDNELLKTLGRLHDAETALKAIRTSREAGFDRVNGDLIFGVPGETAEVWRSSVEGLLDSGVTHMSCYGLTYEEGTPLSSWRRLGKVTPVADDDMADRWETADALLTAAGFGRYEISNWAPAGEECRHNLLYWARGEYLGIGAGAHSHLGGTRSWTVKGPEKYADLVRAGKSTVAGSESLDDAGRTAEVMFLGLRRTSGVTASEFESATGRRLADAYGAELRRLAELGLLAWDGTTARLTRRGTLLANEALSAFLA